MLFKNETLANVFSCKFYEFSLKHGLLQKISGLGESVDKSVNGTENWRCIWD